MCLHIIKLTDKDNFVIVKNLWLFGIYGEGLGALSPLAPPLTIMS